MINPATEKIANAQKRINRSKVYRSATKLNMAFEKILTLALKGDIRIRKDKTFGRSALSDKNDTAAIDAVPKYSPAQRADCPRLNKEPRSTANAEKAKEVSMIPGITDNAKLILMLLNARAMGNIIKKEDIIKIAPEMILAT